MTWRKKRVELGFDRGDSTLPKHRSVLVDLALVVLRFKSRDWRVRSVTFVSRGTVKWLRRLTALAERYRWGLVRTIYVYHDTALVCFAMLLQKYSGQGWLEHPVFSPRHWFSQTIDYAKLRLIMLTY